MANIKSAKKRVITAEKAAARNKATKSKVKTLTKNVETAIESGDKAKASEALKAATVAIDKAGAKGVFHKKAAARKVSTLAKNVNNM